MELAQYEEAKQKLLKLASDIEERKRPDYTIGSVDVLANFKSVAERTHTTPLQVWSVYFLKHIDAICSYVGGNHNPSEPIDARFADALNYLKLGMALIEEER